MYMGFLSYGTFTMCLVPEEPRQGCLLTIMNCNVVIKVKFASTGKVISALNTCAISLAPPSNIL